MYQIDRNSLGLNTITYSAINKGEPVAKETVTVFGNGIIDRIAILVLRILGTIFDDLKPVKFMLSAGKDRYQFPAEMYVTKLALKTLLNVEVECWSAKNEISLNPVTRQEAIGETFESMDEIFKGSDCVFQNSLSILISKLHSILYRRMNAFELFVSEKLANMEGFEGEFEIPISQKTGEILLRGQGAASEDCYRARIKIESDTEGRKALFLKEIGGRDPNFSKEAEHTLKEVIAELKDIIQDPINLKQVAEKLRDAVFARNFLELDQTPILDRSEETMIVLNPSKDSFLPYDIANHINLGGQQYIATMYPKSDELWKYWEMIFEERCPVIVKLNDIKKGRDPAHDPSYWPAPGQTFNFTSDGVELTVENVKEEAVYDFLIRRELKITKNGESFTIVHVDFTNWPDKAVPSTDDIQKLLYQVNLAYESQSHSMCLEKANPPQAPSETSAEELSAVPKSEEEGKADPDTDSAPKGSNPKAAPAEIGSPEKALVDRELEKLLVVPAEEATASSLASDLPASPVPPPEGAGRPVDETESLTLETAFTTVAKSAPESTPVIQKTPIAPGPIAVHCVAGQGRTGTFIGIHSSLKEENPDFMKLVYQMRMQRNNKMIETDEQFLFVKKVHALYHQ